MTVAIGVDDTDSRAGMCTTYLASELIREFDEFDLIGYPRLVRLNPNIPWKTRGNGAICLRFGRGSGKRLPVCKIGRKTFEAFERGQGNHSAKEFEDRVAKVVESHYQLEDENTNPAFVVLEDDPPPSLYWKAVRGIVKLDSVKDLVSGKGVYRLYKNGRGLIGASSAVSWVPGDHTFEIIGYRHESMWGAERELQKDSIIAMDRMFNSTFNNYDYEENHVAIAPSSPCPVLFGIRGDSPEDLIPAFSMVKGEEAQRWTVFLTNQGTDDHLVKRRVKAIGDYESAITSGEVVRRPRVIRGGHMFLRISDGDEIDCAAYEPSKGFRKIVGKLEMGDAVTVYGSVRTEPRTINVEKIQIRTLAMQERKIANPECPQCGKRMKSIGSSAGYRCRKCHLKLSEDSIETTSLHRSISPGFYEPPVSARRHLSKPLKRMQKTSTSS